MNQPLITIGISTYDRCDHLRDYTLPSLQALSYSNYEVIVIDDGSSDDTLKILHDFREKISNFYYYQNPKNKGICYSRNRILEKARGEIIVLVDDDVSLYPDCLEEIVKVYARDPEILFIWGCVYQCHGDHDRNDPTYANSLFSIKRIIAKYFQFDTNIRYFKTYALEEHEFSRRVRRAGAKIVQAPTVRANHYQAPAENRPRRGLGGDLHRLYEKAKLNSLSSYYNSLVTGVVYVVKIHLLKRQYNLSKIANAHPFREGVNVFHMFLILLKERKFITAGQYLFYALFDIPIKAKIKARIERDKTRKFVSEFNKIRSKKVFSLTIVNIE